MNENENSTQSLLDEIERDLRRYPSNLGDD